jgi:hypothetical protein
MNLDPIIVAANLLSVIVAGALIVSTTRPCKLSNVPYLLGIPAGFGLITAGYLAQTVASLGIPNTSFFLNFIYLMTQTYGLLFLGFTYARRTRLRFIGESTPIELAVAVLITLTLFIPVFASPVSVSPDVLPVDLELFLRTITLLLTCYLIYETARSWRFLRKAVDGYVVIAFVLLVVGNFGFMLAAVGLGIVVTFLGYEGRLVGLLLLNALVLVGVKKDDFMTVLKRLGLGAMAH